MNSEKKILMGIGSEIRGDDAIGTSIARGLEAMKKDPWLALPCETVPENFAGIVEREKPALLVLVDAANMNLKAGEFRLLPKKKLNSVVFGTHGMPLKHLVARLEKSAKKTLFIGVQPKGIGLSETLSSELEKAKQRLLEIISKEKWNEIKSL
jgi:hydrogenase 3 maturation protease